MVRNFWLALGCLSLSLAPAAAQEGVLSELYGSGVHAYFAGRSWKALEHFNSAIDNGSEDPRAFYFRGLTYLQLGDGDSAGEDYAHAAELETKDSNEFYDVSRALERIQGPQRLAIERYRTAGRLAALQRARQIEYERYERIRQAEPDVTIPPETAPIEETPETEVVPPAAAPGAVPPAGDADNPFTEEPAMDEPVEEPAAEPAADEPVEEPAAEPAADEPVAEPAAEPAADELSEPAMDEPLEEPAMDEPAEEPAAEPALDEPLEAVEPDATPEPDGAFEPDAPADLPVEDLPTEEPSPTPPDAEPAEAVAPEDSSAAAFESVRRGHSLAIVPHAHWVADMWLASL